MISGVAATNSLATARIFSALPPANLYSIDKFRPSVQPWLTSRCLNAPRRRCASGSLLSKGARTATRYELAPLHTRPRFSAATTSAGRAAEKRDKPTPLSFDPPLSEPISVEIGLLRLPTATGCHLSLERRVRCVAVFDAALRQTCTRQCINLTRFHE